MNDLNFQHIVSTPDGKNSTKGKQMEQAWNDNFDKIKELFTNVFTAMAIGITSDKMKQIKVDTSTTPYTLYYSLDDESIANPVWIKLIEIGFSDIKGNPLDNIALKEQFDSKASSLDFDSLVLRVQGNTDSITNLTNIVNNINQLTGDTIDDIKDDIKDNLDKITDLQEFNKRVVQTPDDHLWLKCNPVTNEISISLDEGQNWTVIATVGLKWSELNGDITQNTDLVNYVKNTLDKALLDYVKIPVYNQHLSDHDNPHEVTANQLGLGNVLTEIRTLQESQSIINKANIKSLVKHASLLSGQVYLTSHSFGRAHLHIEDLSNYDVVATLTGTQTYTGPDGFVISLQVFEDNPDSIPVYYLVDYTLESTLKLQVSYNALLHDYIKKGGVLD